MVLFIIFLRIVHILAGVFWVGATILLTAFIVPAARIAAVDSPQVSQKFMQALMARGRLTTALGIASGLTILAGIVLYGIDSGGFQMSWITSGVGLGFTSGALAALASVVLSSTVIRSTGERLSKLGAAIQEAGSQATPAQRSEMEQLNARMRAAGQVNIVLLVIALLAMAVARYL